jgi:CheY-like chemotaxis protein
LVEDSESAVIQLTDILGNEGYRIHVARNGAEALAQVQQALPDALILDLMMPEVDGFQVLKEIRGQERTAHLPVLILTAKHVTKEELSFLKGNHIHQLIQKGDVNKAGLLAEVARMVAPPPIPIPTSAFRASRSQLRSGKPVVLIVEDNPDSLRTAHALLSERYQVIEAADGRAGVEQARVHRPDIILMDIAMPVMDGIAALLEIRADDALRATPVIAVTASAMKGDRETILAHGFDGYLSKPIDHDALMKTLQQMLD